MKIVKVSPRTSDSVYTPVRSLIDDFFGYPLTRFDDMLPDTTFGNLSADMWEDKENVYVKMAMPGISKEDIKISMDNDSICISGHSKEKEEEKNDKRYYLRSMESNFEQTFNLPVKVNDDQADASFENGVLTVKLPKAKESKVKEISIK